MSFQIGDIVVTRANPALDVWGWTDKGLAAKRFGIHGLIVDHSDGHGEVYRIRHSDGTYAWYDPLELVLANELSKLDFKEFGL